MSNSIDFYKRIFLHVILVRIIVPCSVPHALPTLTLVKSSRLQMLFQIDVLEKFRNIYSKTPVLESLFNKVGGLKACNFIKKRLQLRCFSGIIAKTFCEKLFCRAPHVHVSFFLILSLIFDAKGITSPLP